MRILIVNPFGIGDVLFTTPIVRALRQAFPDAHLAYLCNRRTQRILEGNPHLNAVLVFEKDEFLALWRSSRLKGLNHVRQLLGIIRRQRFELVVDLSLGQRYSFVLMLLGIQRRVGFDFRRRGRFLTHRLPIEGYHEAHVIEYYRRLSGFLGIRLDEQRLELGSTDEDRQWAQAWLAGHRLADQQPVVGIVPAGGVSWGLAAPFRRWSLEGFAAVGDALSERYGAHVVLFGEAADAPVCRQVIRLMKHPAVDASGQTMLGQFVALLAHLDLVICNDGGPLHLAVSQRTKTVSVFGPVDPAVYGPYPRSARHHVVFREDLPCRPCYHQFKLPPCPYERACLKTIEPDEVLGACEAALSMEAVA